MRQGWMRGVRRTFACACAMLATAGAAQQPDALRAIVAENDAIAAQIAADGKALERASNELSALRKETRDLDERMERIERRAAVYSLGQEFVRALTEQLRQLPAPKRFEAAEEKRAELLVAASDASLRAERALSDLADLDAATAQRLAAATPPIAQAQQPQVAAAVQAALAAQRELLQRLAVIERTQIEILRGAGDADRDLQRQAEAAKTQWTRFLFWIPAAPSTDTIGEAVPALAWAVAPANWRAAGSAAWRDLSGRPREYALMLFLAATLFALRGRLKAWLLAHSPAVIGLERYRIGHCLGAFAITIALALPGPILLWVLARALLSAPADQAFTLALGSALQALVRLVLMMLILAWLLDRSGVAVRHFGWDEATVADAAIQLRRFAAVFVPLIFMAAFNGTEHAPYGNRESLGRLAFSLAMLALAVFMLRVRRRGSPLLQRLRARAPRGWAVALYPVWSGALVAVPLAVAAIAAAGYFVAAGYFFARILESAFLAAGAMMLYGLMALWVQLRRTKLALDRISEAAPTATAAEAGSEVAQVQPAQLDIALLGERTRSLLNMLVTLLLVGGLWWVWRDAFPVLSVIGDYALWNSTEVVDGKRLVHPLTVAHLLLAIVVGMVTVVIARNVGALLDILLLQRLEMRTDSTYAIKVIARYGVAAAGLLIACHIIGLQWNDVQWLVAALTVGLGFGLQEIVANFVSGLIVLAERPIRIGDVVTVGGVSGTVASIQARATVVVDFDNKEVIIPNKAFITERVVNWTLTDATSRLLIKVGVAYGSDIGLVQRLLLDAVRVNRDVARSPAPSVFMVAFGDSSLDFEIRAYVDSIDKRLRVAHEINTEVERVLRENGVEMPFPQRDLHIRSAAGLANALRSEQNG